MTKLIFFLKHPNTFFDVYKIHKWVYGRFRIMVDLLGVLKLVEICQNHPQVRNADGHCASVQMLKTSTVQWSPIGRHTATALGHCDQDGPCTQSSKPLDPYDPFDHGLVLKPRVTWGYPHDLRNPHMPSSLGYARVI